MRDAMQGAKRSDTLLYREHLQRRSAPAAGEPNVQVIPERTLSIQNGRVEFYALPAIAPGEELTEVETIVHASIVGSGADTVTVFARPDGSRIYSETDESGRLLRRYRRAPDGREIIIIDNRYGGPPTPFGYFVDLPPPVIRIPREHYIVDAEYAQPDEPPARLRG